MSRTKRNASRWFEIRFKLGDPRFPEDNAEFFNGRYQAKMRNGMHSYHSNKIDPRTYKVISWKEYGRDIKVMAKRAVRRNAKILIILETSIIMDEVWQDEQILMWEDEVRYYDHLMGFDYSYSDEAYDYNKQRRQEELENDRIDYDYDPSMDWGYS